MKEHEPCDYASFVRSRVKAPYEITMTLTGRRADLIHASMGISGEAGELLDAIKKHVIYDKELDVANVIEELGDLEFYMEQIRQRIGVTRDECIRRNIKKLSKRYSSGSYSDKEASTRADKVLQQGGAEQ